MTKISEFPKEENKYLERIGNDKQTHIWKQHTYDLGTWTKEQILRNNKMKYSQHLQTLYHRSLNNPTTTRKLKGSSPSWNTIVDIIPNKQI